MVKAHQAHTKGFTLAELLLSVAILLVLAALAFPSIVSAQNNMRMVELNNAAESIANAAQSQMTAKKVSGAWWSLVESEGLAQTKAVNLPDTINGRPTDAKIRSISRLTKPERAVSSLLLLWMIAFAGAISS